MIKFSHFIVLLVFLTISNHCVGQKKMIDPLSNTSLKIEIFSKNASLGTATGFLIEKNNKYYLITNLHVVTGLDYYSKAIVDSLHRIPYILGIWHNSINLGDWFKIPELLYTKDDKKRWIECGYSNDKPFDLIALPLENIPATIKLNPLKIDQYKDSLMVQAGFPVSIIGFPYGMSSYGRFAIWKTGHIASDPDIDCDGFPVLMIDATTRPGMSGSIVVVRQPNYMDYKGNTMMGRIGTSIIGVYSAQSNQEEIGYVWKPIALKMLIDKLP